PCLSETLSLSLHDALPIFDMIAGSLAVSGTVSVGAAAAVPVVTKTTSAFIGDNSIVQGLGQLGSGIRVSTGGFLVDAVDTRFTPDRKSTRLNSSHVKISYA